LDSPVFLYGVINASPDSLNADSIATDVSSALARAKLLLANGCQGFDLGAQGSTDIASIVPPDQEWDRAKDIIPALATLGRPLSIDTWKPEVARLALAAGATVLNAADGLQADGMMEVAAEFGCPVVLPYLNGPDPRSLRHVEGDPLTAMVEWFGYMLERADAFGIRENMILDPGTGFAPLAWEWASRYHFQKHVYSGLDRLRVFNLPLYIALPWKVTDQHMELLEIVIRQQVEYGRTHYPETVIATADRLGYPRYCPPSA
jgi:dihydropteroate synthase